MNDFNDDLFAFINDEIIEFSIRELIDYQFNLRILDDSTNYTKEEKINFMKNLIADIEKCISIIEKDEHARLSEVWEISGESVGEKRENF